MGKFTEGNDEKMAKAISSNLGYPRLEEKREWKRALENYWNGEITEEELLKETKAIRLLGLKKQKEHGIDLIPVGDFTLYDHVLDASVSFGVIPERFGHFDELIPLKTYFDIARGNKDAVASEMTKWFNTNYHYIVPEFENVKPRLLENKPLKAFQEAKEELGIEGKPVIIGPFTYVKLGKGNDKLNFSELVWKFIPVYQKLLEELDQAGVSWVQIDEPALATTFPKEELAILKKIYTALREVTPHLKIELQTYFESLDYYEEIVKLPVDGIGIDFVHDHEESLQKLIKHGFPANKYLAAGVIDGRNIWRSHLSSKRELITKIKEFVAIDRLIIQPASSLLHVPITKWNEPDIDDILLQALSFADEKLTEIALLAEYAGVENTPAAFLEADQAHANLNNSIYRNNQIVQEELRSLDKNKIKRNRPYKERIKLQHAKLQLPLLPTTTIGSFPQSSEVRKKRADWLKKRCSDSEYETFIKKEIARWINIQEQLDLDVLVHGEFERTDMVEYFGQKLAGFQATKFGWVQSYGSRAVRPPLIYGDVAFTEPITVKESVYAKRLTDRPVKGMLTAPLTIINWSFVRDDIPESVAANQIGLALRKEVTALEKAGISIIQVDEPALREGLPLKRKRWQQYLDDAVYSFKIATTSVRDETQIHTHMCYSDFEDIIDTISALDADVISIEASRSHGEIIAAFEKVGYDKEIGLGVYDIHSPRIPAINEITNNIKRALKVIDVKQFWVNPDCGLKTRKETETIAALKAMIQSTKQIRAEYSSRQ